MPDSSNASARAPVALPAEDSEPAQPAVCGYEPQFAGAIVTPYTPPVAVAPFAWKRTRAVSAITARQRG